MKLFRFVTLLVIMGSVPARAACAQGLGEPTPPRPYDTVGSMQYTFQRWAPNEKVREVQQALQDKGYYQGPLDGVLNPQFRSAIWNFQRAKGLLRTARLDAATLAALELPASGAASPATTQGFGATSPPALLNGVEAP